MANSSTVSSGELATAAQYNNLRDDVLSVTTGHLHDGSNGRNDGAFNLNVGGLPLTLENTTDGVSNQILLLRGDNATRADNDEIYITLSMDDDGGNSTEFVRLSALATDVSDTTEDGQFDIDVMIAGTLTKVAHFNASGLDLAASDSLSVNGTNILSDSAGTMTLSNIDALDATTEATIEAAIDTGANLTSIQGLTVTLADAGADAIFGWDDTAGAYENLTAAEAAAAAGLGTSDSPTFAGLTLNGNLSMGDDDLIVRDVNAGLTASTTQTQGQGALTAEINEVATVANASDTVTLPTAAAGLHITVINNGANTLQIFPASGDNLGAGADTATTLAAGSEAVFIAYDATNWEQDPGAGGSGPSQATQSALKAETNENTYAPPDLIKHSPGVAKVWLRWEQSGVHSITASYNMTSVTDGGAAGDTDHLWGVDFSGIGVYTIVGGAENNGTLGTTASSYAAGGVTTITRDAGSGTPVDLLDMTLAAFGDQ